MLAYRLPREPSTPRISLWRRLKRLGVVQLLDGLVALPADAKTREQLEWAAEEVIEAGGDATLWIGRPGTAAEERSLAARMSEAVAADYRAVSRSSRGRPRQHGRRRTPADAAAAPPDAARNRRPRLLPAPGARTGTTRRR